MSKSGTKVWRHPSGEEGWKNSSLREFDGPLSLEERRTCKTPPEIYRGRVVLRGHNVKDEEGYRAVFTEQGASASRMAAAKFLDTFSKLVGMAGETQFQRTFKSKWPKLPDGYQCRTKSVLKMLIIILHGKDQKVVMILKTQWYFLKDTYIVTHCPAYFGKENLKKKKKWYLKRAGRKYQHWNVFSCTRSSYYFYRYLWMM